MEIDALLEAFQGNIYSYFKWISRLLVNGFDFCYAASSKICYVC